MVKKWKKGSLTIEAACVMSLILLAVMGILYLCFYVHNRAWLTAAAYEAALSGSMEGIREDGQIYETALADGKMLGNMGFYGAENLSVRAAVGKSTQVVYEMDTIAGFGGFNWHLKAQGSAVVVRPVQWIRKLKAAAEIVEGLGD